MNNNIFCPSNANVDIDIDSSTGTSGDNNRCEKPGTWNDVGTIGCTYYCDNPPIVTLLYPPNNFLDSTGNIEFVCQSRDDSQLTNVTLYHNITGTWQANQTLNISGTSNITTFSINNILDGTYLEWNCLAYDNHSRGSFANVNWSINISILPNDTHKFYIKDNSGNPVAWLGDKGNIVLKGNCTNQSICTAPANSFIVKNSSDNTVAYIDNQGNLCVDRGDCSDQSASCNPTRDAFIIRNSSNYNMSYIDFNGDLCLTGDLYTNIDIN